jgi:outer membrane protein TolC
MSSSKASAVRAALLPAMATAAVALAGCAGFSADGGFEPVRQAARERLDKEVAWARNADDEQGIARRVAELLAPPLTADAAVQIALLNHRGLQARYESLGIAEAELVRASRLPNPGVTWGRLRRGDEREIDRIVTFNLGRLVMLPLARGVEERRFAAVQAGVSLQMLSHASQARKAFYAAVAAEQAGRYMADVQSAAEASAELARRMAEAGNWSRLQQAREQGFHADAALNVARARQAQLATRERLIRLLGLAGTQTAFTLPDRLPELPTQPAERPDIEQRAMAERLDVQAATRHTEATAKHLGLSRVTHFVNVLELGAASNTSNVEPHQTGFEISLELPLFDWSGARVAQAEAVYRQSLQRAAQVAIDACSEVREAYEGTRLAWDIARQYRDEVVPAAQRTSDENLRRYNGMLIGVFDLLADARAQIAAVNASIQAQRDYWLAQADLDMALIGPPPSTPTQDLPW